MAWGQYVHWANIQYENKEQLDEDCTDSIFIGVMSHWIAAQYVVIEGWNTLKINDDVINKLLTSYPDYIDIFRRCRNAVYHYQNTPLDGRILEAIKGEEQNSWLLALKWEFERYLYLYPFKTYGVSKIASELGDEFFGCIGWKPSDNLRTRWIDISSACQNYVTNNELNSIARTDENDKIITEVLDNIREIQPNFLL